MRKDVFAAGRFLAVPTIALVTIALLAPGRAEPALRIYALVLAATAIAVLVRALRRAYPNEIALHEPAVPGPTRGSTPSLGRIEHEVALGIVSSFDLHYRLVPRLRALAGGLLQERRNVSLDASPSAARELLGEETWALVRPDRAAPEDRLAGGISVRELGRAVDALEAI